jgi:hypothetical protein
MLARYTSTTNASMPAGAAGACPCAPHDRARSDRRSYRNYMMACAALMIQGAKDPYFALIDAFKPPGVRNLQLLIEEAWASGAHSCMFDCIVFRASRPQAMTRRAPKSSSAACMGRTNGSARPVRLPRFHSLQVIVLSQVTAQNFLSRSPTLASRPNSLTLSSRGAVLFEVPPRSPLPHPILTLRPPVRADTKPLLDWIKAYFSPPEQPHGSVHDAWRNASPVTVTDRLPLILQHNGHSRTIVGYLVDKKGQTVLLTFDPSRHAPVPRPPVPLVL